MKKVLSLRIFALKMRRKMVRRRNGMMVNFVCQFVLAIGAQKFVLTFLKVFL